MKKILFLLLLTISLTTLAQNSVKKELKSIENFEQAEGYLETKKSKKNKLMVFNKEKHKSKLAKELLEMPIGFTKTEEEQFKLTHYKVVKKTKDVHYRVSYIYFDGNKISIDKIYELRKIIMEKHGKGVPFGDLAKKYSMATNARKNGDSGWVKENDLPIEIETEAYNLKHGLDAIYDVRTEKDNGYYIIKKTHRIMPIKEVYVLKVQQNKD